MKRIPCSAARALLASLLALLLAGGLYTPAFAHGAKIEYTVATTINLTAMYDSGEPMSGAQVTIYAPDDLKTPWLTGACEENGNFSFMPDPSKPGVWDVQVRQAGHGDMVHIAVGEGGGAMSGSTGFSPLQIIIMAACVIWGFVGTALFFSRKRQA